MPVFCLDDRLLHGRHASGPRTQFLLECLRDLDARAARARRRARGAPRAARARAGGAGARGRARELHFSADVSPFARARARAGGRALLERLELHAHPGLSAVDDVGALRTQAGEPVHGLHAVPPRLAAGAAPRRARRPARAAAAAAAAAQGRLPSLDALGLAQEVASRRRAASARRASGWRASCAGDVRGYAADHDALASDRTSRLSPYLHFGCVSAREVEARLRRGAGPTAFRRQLCWRDFYHHVLLHFPRNARSEFQERYRGTIAGAAPTRRFEAWCEGRTGYPLVDAGMRQLRREGWMHNRARLVVGSFLTKDLGIDWRWGERCFMRLLVDGDEANNNGNWQWIASVGTDPQPAFRRIYNPARQMERTTPTARTCAATCPSCARCPTRYLRRAVDDARRGAARGRLRRSDATTRSRSSTTPQARRRRSSATGSERGSRSCGWSAPRRGAARRPNRRPAPPAAPRSGATSRARRRRPARSRSAPPCARPRGRPSRSSRSRRSASAASSWPGGSQPARQADTVARVADDRPLAGQRVALVDRHLDRAAARAPRPAKSANTNASAPARPRSRQRASASR